VELRSRGTYLLFRALAPAIARVPEPVSAAVSAAVVAVIGRRDTTARRMAERHLERVLASRSPAVAPDPALVRRWARRSLQEYGRYWLEAARLPALDPAEVARRIFVEEGYEHLEQGMAAGRGVVMALPHVGSWEWGGAFLAAKGYPMTTVAERLEPPELFEWFIAQRRAMGITVVPLDQASSGTLLRTLRSGGLVGLLCERDLTGTGVEVEFFGERTTFPAGPATLALRSGAVLVAAVVYRGPGRHHHGLVSAPLPTARTGSLRGDVARLTQRLAEQFELFIGRAPEQWHMFQPVWPGDRHAAGS